MGWLMGERVGFGMFLESGHYNDHFINIYKKKNSAENKRAVKECKVMEPFSVASVETNMMVSTLEIYF